MTDVRWSAAGSVAVAVLLVGCGSVAGTPVRGADSNGAQSATSTSRAGGHDGGGAKRPYAGAPKVQHPAGVAAYVKDPCSLVTERQGHALGLPTGKKKIRNGKPSCFWQSEHNISSSNPIAVSVTIESSGTGLSRFYKDRQTEGFVTTFKPQRPVNGFPVLHYANERAPDSPGDCGLFVGVRDDRVISIFSQDREDDRDACSVPGKVAKAVTATIRKGS